RAKLVFIFDNDNRLTMRRTGQTDRLGKFSVKFSLRPGLFKEIDISPSGEDEETSLNGLAIFKLEDDCLEFAMASHGEKVSRPTGFDAQKGIAVFRFEKIKLGLADKTTSPPKSSEKPVALAGRWELIAEEKTNESLEIEFIRPIFGDKKELLFRRKM